MIPEAVRRAGRVYAAGPFLLLLIQKQGILLVQTFMSQIQLIQIKNKETGETYWTRKNKRKVERKIELKKYSKALKKHITFKEVKK